MGILRVPNLCSPPYVYTNPHTLSHKVTDDDLFVVLGSDGLFDFFSNDEVVHLVYQFMHDNPIGDPAKYLIEQLLLKAAKEAGIFQYIF
jgi:serine/threonine protein phosphatase PrpC